MAYPVASFVDDMLDIVATTWTDVVPPGGGIHRYDDAARVEWETKVFPFAVWQMPVWEPADWGLTNVAWEPIFEVHYLRKIPAVVGDGLAAVEVKLMQLRDAVYAGAFAASSATILDVAAFDSSGSHPANEAFYEKNVPFVGGMIAFRFSVGETAV